MLEVYLVGLTLWGAMVVGWFSLDPKRYQDKSAYYKDGLDGRKIFIGVLVTVFWPITILPSAAAVIGSGTRKEKK